MSTLLVTGGTGFIGSHTCISLLESGYKIIVLDSGINSNKNVISRIYKIGERENQNFHENLFYVEGDLRDTNLLNKIFKKAENNNLKISAVIHLAGLKAVEESINNPIDYWSGNVSSSINLLSAMQKNNCHTIVFSSSATIYGTNHNELKLTESSKISPINPYGDTKVAIEKILKNIFNGHKNSWRIANLRYFNPIGSHNSGLIGEDPKGIPNNLFPYICQVALGKLKKLQIYGNDWPTKDGTCIRDFIHVMDLADAHTSALNFLKASDPIYLNLNIGTGNETSVLELTKIFKRVNKSNFLYEFTDRREGDICRVIADNKLAISTLDWLPKRTIEDMCIDGWKWQNHNLKFSDITKEHPINYFF